MVEENYLLFSGILKLIGFSRLNGFENIFKLSISASVVLSILPGFFKNKSRHSSFVFIKKLLPPAIKIFIQLYNAF